MLAIAAVARLVIGLLAVLTPASGKVKCCPNCGRDRECLVRQDVGCEESRHGTVDGRSRPHRVGLLWEVIAC